jgi:hypothetical protein
VKDEVENQNDTRYWTFDSKAIVFRNVLNKYRRVCLSVERSEEGDEGLQDVP